ncbi:radical SAM protein [Candidatus Bathyarchaeota archaeon]|nr:MAG: radical SAM protein [Candidatus Bathyarchaeota archaeon]
MKSTVFEIDREIPLVGCISFGIIDRGTNLLQIRPISLCPLSCIFCSTDAGPKSRIRQAEYIVPLDYMIEEFKKLVALKGKHSIEAHIDTVGDPITYPKIVDLVHEISQIDGVKTISLQTHGSILNEKLLDDLSAAGLTRINFSLDALDPDLARRLADTGWYDAQKSLELMRYITANTSIDLLIAPVWIPNFNDEEIPKIIKFALEVGAGKLFPPLGIQKYLIHKHGRKVKGVRPHSWREFYANLKRLEKQFGVKLILKPSDFGIYKCRMLPAPYRKYSLVKVKVVGPGWMKGEKLAVTDRGDRAVTLINASEIPIGARVKARIIENKHNILIADPLL